MKYLVEHALVMTVMLLVGCIVCRLAMWSQDNSVPHDILLQALRWKEQAREEMDPNLRLQQLASASALLDMARNLSTDAELERGSGVDVSRMERSLSTRLANARQSCGAATGESGSRMKRDQK